MQERALPARWTQCPVPQEHTGHFRPLAPDSASNPETKAYYAKQTVGKAALWGKFMGGVFSFKKNPIRDLIIISLLAEKPNKWQEKASQLTSNTRTLTHTKMKDPSFKAAANFPSFKRLGEKNAGNECAFSTGSLRSSPGPSPSTDPLSSLSSRAGNKLSDVTTES